MMRLAQSPPTIGRCHELDDLLYEARHLDQLRLLRSSGFEIEDLIEIQAPEGATTRFPYHTADWARQWPSEEIWKARKRGSMP